MFWFNLHVFLRFLGLVHKPKLKAKATTEGIENKEYVEEDSEDADDSSSDEYDESNTDEQQNTEVIVSLPRSNQVKYK